MKKRIPAIILMFAQFLTTSYAANTYRKTKTISVYDDFTEIVTAAYKLERTITICRGELDLYNESINAN